MQVSMPIKREDLDRGTLGPVQLCPPYLYLLLLPLLLALAVPTTATTAAAPSDSVHFCLPIDFDRWERNRAASAAKRLGDLAAGEPGSVRLVYFLPSDRPFRAGVVDSMKSVIGKIQRFNGEQMQARGFGVRSFPVETDAAGEPLVHRVDGEHPEIHYEEDTFGTVFDELGPGFDPGMNVYMIVIDNSINRIGNSGLYSGGAGSRRGKNGGVGLFPAGSVEWGGWDVAAHELGHAFGLHHDFHDDAYIMSYGGGQRRSLSACNAEFLAVHPYFSSDTSTGSEGRPFIELTSPATYPVGSESVPVQLEVNAPDGLHQVMLFVNTVGERYRGGGLYYAAGFPEVKACRGSSGDTLARVEFEYDGVIPSGGFTSLSDPVIHPIWVFAADRDGDVGMRYFELTQRSPYLIADQETEKVISVALSPDGSTLALGRQDSRIELRDVVTATSAGLLGSGHSRWVNAVAFSPDGFTLASGADDPAIRLWDVATGSLVATLEGHPKGIASLAFSPDGRSLASAGWWDDTVRLWDVATAANTVTLEGTGPLAFSRDGRTLASVSSDMRVRLWEVATGTETFAAPRHDSWINLLALSPAGSMVAFGSVGGDIKLWDAASGEHAATLGHRVVSVAWSADGGALASGSSEGDVVIWDLTGAKLTTLGRHSGRVGFVAFRPDGLTLVSASNSYLTFFDGSARGAYGGYDETIKLWDVSEWIGPRPHALEIVSGDDQRGPPGEDLAEPFVVEVRDQNEDPLPGVEVTFTVAARDGRLGGRFTVEEVTTDASGRAASRLTLGSDPGRNRVEASVGGLTVTFRSLGVGTPIPFMEGDFQTWHLPEGAVARLGKGAFGFVSYEGDRGVVFSPDGRYLAVQSLIGIWLYDVASAREVALLPLEEDIGSLAFSPDGTILASGSMGVLSPGSYSGKGSLRMWDIAARQTLADLKGHRGSEILDASTGRSLLTLEGYTESNPSLRSISFSPDGALLASASLGEIRLWDVATRTSAGTLGEHDGELRSVAFSPDGTALASAADDRTIRIWDVATGQRTATMEGHGGPVRSVSFSPDGASLASGADDRTIRIWDVATGQDLSILEGHKGAVRSVSFSPDGTALASGSEDETVRLWDVATGAATATLEGHAHWVRSVAFSPDGRTLASTGAWDGKVNLWDLATGSAAVLGGHRGWVMSVSLSPDGRMLASGVRAGGGRAGVIELWDVRAARKVSTFVGGAGYVRALSFSPDGRLLASGWEDHTVRLWDLETGAGTATLEGHTGRVASVAFSPDGATLASGSHDRSIKLWDVATGTKAATLEEHADGVSSVAFSPDGAILASGSFDHTVKLWDVTTGTNTATLEGHTHRVRFVAFSPDGRTLASGTESGTDMVKLWDVASGANTATLEGHASVTSVVFSPDGATVVTGSWDGTINVWDVMSGTYTTAMDGQGAPITSISLSADGTAFATGDDYGIVLLWDVRRIQVHPQALGKLSGDGQQAAPGARLAEPFVISVLDQNGEAYAGAKVAFAVTGGGGTVSVEGVTTDSEGRAATTLTLGVALGTHTVEVTVDGLEPVTFTANAKASPDFDGDGEVGFSDFFLFAEAFGGYDPRFDLDGSGFVYFADFLLFAEHFGQPARAKLVALARELIGLPDGPQLRQNAPNPFNSGTVISWFQLQSGPARLEVFALTGQRVAVLHEGPRKAGLHRLRWDGRDDQGRALASGVYVYRLVTAEAVQTRKLTLLR